MKLKNNIQNRTALALAEQRKQGLVLRGGAFKGNGNLDNRKDRREWKQNKSPHQINDDPEENIGKESDIEII